MANTTTTIGPNTHVQGSIAGDTPLHVEGTVHGQISLEEVLTIEESGSVQGEVHVNEAVVHGHMDGTLVAREKLTLSSSARVTGHIEAPIIRMDDGAVFTGEVEMDIDAQPVVAKTQQTRSSFTTPTRQTTTATTRKPATTSTPVAKPAPKPVAAPAAPPAPAQTQSAPAKATTTTVVVEQEPEPIDEPTEESSIDPELLAEYDEQTVKELREELRRRDLPVSGTKQELIERLVESSDA